MKRSSYDATELRWSSMWINWAMVLRGLTVILILWPLISRGDTLTTNQWCSPIIREVTGSVTLNCILANANYPIQLLDVSSLEEGAATLGMIALSEFLNSQASFETLSSPFFVRLEFENTFQEQDDDPLREGYSSRVIGNSSISIGPAQMYRDAQLSTAAAKDVILEFPLPDGEGPGGYVYHFSGLDTESSGVRKKKFTTVLEGFFQMEYNSMGQGFEVYDVFFAKELDPARAGGTREKVRELLK